MAVYVANSGADTLEGGDGHDGLWGAMATTISSAALARTASSGATPNTRISSTAPVPGSMKSITVAATPWKIPSISSGWSAAKLKIPKPSSCSLSPSAALKSRTQSAASPFLKNEGVGAEATVEIVEAGTTADGIGPAWQNW